MFSLENTHRLFLSADLLLLLLFFNSDDLKINWISFCPFLSKKKKLLLQFLFYALNTFHFHFFSIKKEVKKKIKVEKKNLFYSTFCTWSIYFAEFYFLNMLMFFICEKEEKPFFLKNTYFEKMTEKRKN